MSTDRGWQRGRLVLLVAGSALFILPAAWMVATALKPVEQTMSLPPRWLPYTHETEVDGVVREVGVSPGVDAPHDRFVAAFQWKVRLDGEEVPARRIDQGKGQAGERVEVAVSVRTEATIDGRRQAVRTVAGHAEGPYVEVVARDASGHPVVRRVRRSDLVERFNTTKEAVRHPCSRMVKYEVDPVEVRRHAVDWGQREAMPFVFTQERRVGTVPLRRRVRPRLENFPDALRAMRHFPTYLANTITLCVLTVVGTVVSSAVVAYGFSVIQWPGRDRLFAVVLATMMIPFPVTMVPLYGLFRWLGWIGTLKPLWVPSFFAAAFNVFLLRQFFRRIPRELAEAARIDGCSEARLLLQIIVPLARPALAVVALFQFLATWNDFLGPLIYLTDQQDFTIALGLQFFQRQHGGTQWHHLMAAATLLVVPVVLVFFAAQRTFIQGVAMTGLKG